MRSCLFGLLMLFCAAIVTGVLILLMGTGAFHAGEQQVRQTLEQELSYRAQAAYQEFGDISVRGVDLAETLSQTLERRLAAQKAATRGAGGGAGAAERPVGGDAAPPDRRPGKDPGPAASFWYWTPR